MANPPGRAGGANRLAYAVVVAGKRAPDRTVARPLWSTFPAGSITRASIDWESLAPTDFPAEIDGFKREVVMWCDDEPCIYAKTSVSNSTASMHPWLRTLGSEPLGERLQSLADVTRTDFEFTCVQANGAEDRSLGRSFVSGDLWARRSKFTIKSHELAVIEVFLPGLVTCKGHRSGHG